MIKLIDNFEQYDFSAFENDVLFQRIYSDYLTLSSFENVMFYISVNEKVDAVISKVEGNVTISAKENATFEEINEFLNVVGFSKILCDKKFSSFLKGKKTDGWILKIHSDKHFGCKVNALCTENLNDMYTLLKNVFKIEPDYYDWFADLSHKLRHGSANFYGIYENEKLVSGAFSLFETEKSAVISSVATDEDFRRKGYGEAVVKTLLDKNYGKDVYVFTENEKIKKWYKKMGFVPYKMWSEIENVL